jgi:hypothetical protein
MSRTKIKIIADGPILPGSVSTAKSQCGKPNCACKAKPPRLHGPFYRWTGVIDGKRTTKTISKEMAKECARRIKNYRALQGMLDQVLEKAISSAPWEET